MRHIVWDWNGTLLADQEIVLAALNAVLEEAGLPPTTMARYRELYRRPVRAFYESLFGRPVDDREWDRLDRVYHEHYRTRLAEARLAHDALDALEHVDARMTRTTQSLLSMWRHAELLPEVRRRGLHDYFLRVDGLRGPAGERKASYLEAHLRALEVDGAHANEIVVIGDAIDDAYAAEHVGARAVLYDGGSHPRQELESLGFPVAESLVEALDHVEPR